jgi:deoxyribonuclease-4
VIAHLFPKELPMPAWIGRHMPLNPSPTGALRTARAIGCDAIQIFVGNPRGWTPPEDDPAQIEKWAEALRAQQFGNIVVHAAYLINLASIAEITRTRSIHLLRWTMERATAIGASDVVLHTGSHGGDGLEVGLDRLVVGLEQITEGLAPGARLLLENDVGAGNTIGGRFDALATALDRLRDTWSDRVGICLDTAHLWGAGWDIGTPDGARATLDAAGSAFDLGCVAVVHLNDTATALGGHRDIHARLGEGIIGLEGLRALLRDPRLAHATVLLETPLKTLPGSDATDWDDERQRIAFARELCGFPGQ